MVTDDIERQFELMLESLNLEEILEEQDLSPLDVLLILFEKGFIDLPEIRPL